MPSPTTNARISVLEPRFQIFNVFSVIATMITAIYAYLLLYPAHNTVAGLVNVIAAAILILNWFFVWTTGRVTDGINIILLDGTMIMTVFFATGGWDRDGFLAPYAYLPWPALLTTRRGAQFWMGLLFLTILGSVVLDAFGIIDVPYSQVQIGNFFVVYFLFAACVILFHRALERSQWALQKSASDLKKSNSDLLEAQTVAKMGSWEWNVAHDEVVWSPEMYHIFGMTQTEKPLALSAYVEYVHPEDRGNVQAAIDRAMKLHEPFTFEHRFILPNGDIRWIAGKGGVVPDDSGQIMKLLGTAQDITEEKMARAEAERHAAEIERMNKLMTGRELKMAEMKKEIAQLRKINPAS